MTPVYASRRRAEEFHSLVEAAASPGLRDARLDDFLAIVQELRAVPAPEPRPEFVGSLRAELMAAADTLLVPGEQERLALPARSSRRDRAVAAAIGGIAVIGAGTSLAVAAETAMPGEMLYPLKRAIEQAETDLAPNRDAQALVLLESATSRLDEVQTLRRQGDLDEQSAAVADNFVDFGAQAERATGIVLDEYAESGDPAPVLELQTFARESLATLEGLEAIVPASAHDELLAAMEVVGEIDALAGQACPDCGGGIDAIPPVLLSSAATGSPVVIIPGATVDSWGARGAGAGAGPRSGAGSGSGGGDATGDTLSTAPVTTPGADSPGTDDSTGSTLDRVTGEVLGEEPTTAKQGSTDPGKTVGEVVDGAGKKVGEATRELGDTLTGD